LKFRYKKVLLLLIVASAFWLQACVEIVEEVRLNDDQSGSISLSVSLGGNNNPLLALMGQYTDTPFLDQVNENIVQFTQILQSQEGISKVHFFDNKRKGSMELSFDFNNDKNLNKALYALAGYQKKFFQPDIYKIKKQKFVKKNTTDWIVKLIEQERENIPDEILFDLIKIKSVYHIPEKALKIKTSQNVVSSNNDQTFTSSTFLSELIDNKINTRIKIRY